MGGFGRLGYLSGFCANKPGRPRSYLRSSVLIRVHLRLVFFPAFDTIPSRPSGNAASKSRVVPNGTPNGATNFGRRLTRNPGRVPSPEHVMAGPDPAISLVEPD